MTQEETPKEGWNFLWNARKSHWFGTDGTSLCKRWFTLGAVRYAAPQVNPPCATCTKKLEARKS